MMKWRYLLPVLLISALLIPATGCQSDKKAAELIPANVNMIAGIQVSKIINDQDIKDAFDTMDKSPGQPATFDEALDELFQESGIDLKNISHILIFGDIANIEQTEYVGIIAEGNFDETEIVNKIEENANEALTTSDYKGYKLYILEDESFTLSFLNDKVLLVGSIQAVKNSIDVSKGEGQPFEGELLEAFHRYDNALISSVFILPEDAFNMVDDELKMEEIPFSMDAFTGIDMIGFSLDKENTMLKSRYELHFTGTDSIQDANDTLSGLISMIKGMAEEPDLKELLGKIEVSVSEPWLRIDFNIEISQIENLIETYGE
jgi:hypothetical protein